MHSLSGGVCVQVFIETSSPWAVHDMYDGRMSTLCMFYVFVLQSEPKTKTKKKCHKGLTPAAGTSMSPYRCHCRLWALISQQVLSISFMIYLHFWLLTQLGQCLIWDGWKPHPNLNQRHFPQTHLSWPEMWWDCCQGDFMATRQVWTESRQSGLKTALWL